MPLEIVLRANTMLEMGEEVFKLAQVFFPEALKNDDDKEDAPPPPARGRGRPRSKAGAVDTGAHPGPAGEVSPAEAPAAEPAGESVVGRPAGEPDRVRSEAPAEDQLARDTGAAAQEDTLGAGSEPEVPSLDIVEKLARRVAEEKSFSTLKSVFDQFGVKRFTALPADQYGAAIASLEEALAA